MLRWLSYLPFHIHMPKQAANIKAMKLQCHRQALRIVSRTRHTPIKSHSTLNILFISKVKFKNSNLPKVPHREFMIYFSIVIQASCRLHIPLPTINIYQVKCLGFSNYTKSLESPYIYSSLLS